MKVFVLALIIQGIFYGIGLTLVPILRSHHLSLFLIGLSGLSILIHRLTIRTSKTAGDQFPNLYMGIIGIKMFSFLIAASVYFMIMGKQAKAIILSALLAHLVLTVLEVSSTVRLLKRD